MLTSRKKSPKRPHLSILLLGPSLVNFLAEDVSFSQFQGHTHTCKVMYTEGWGLAGGLGHKFKSEEAATSSQEVTQNETHILTFLMKNSKANVFILSRVHSANERLH